MSRAEEPEESDEEPEESDEESEEPEESDEEPEEFTDEVVNKFLEKVGLQLQSFRFCRLLSDDLQLLKVCLTKRLYDLLQDYMKACRLLDKQVIKYSSFIIHFNAVLIESEIDLLFPDLLLRQQMMNPWRQRPKEKVNEKMKIEIQLWNKLCDEYKILNPYMVSSVFLPVFLSVAPPVTSPVAPPVTSPVTSPAILPDEWA